MEEQGKKKPTGLVGWGCCLYAGSKYANQAGGPVPKQPSEVVVPLRPDWLEGAWRWRSRWRRSQLMADGLRQAGYTCSTSHHPQAEQVRRNGSSAPSSGKFNTMTW